MRKLEHEDVPEFTKSLLKNSLEYGSETNATEWTGILVVVKWLGIRLYAS